MSSKELEKYRKYARNARLLLLPVGLWPVENNTLGYRFLSTFAGLSLVLLNYNALNYCYMYISDINKVTRSFSWCISIWTLLLKVVLFVTNREKLLDLNESLGKIFEEELKILEFESVLLQRLSVFTGVYYSMVVALAGAFTLFAVIPLIFMITEREKSGEAFFIFYRNANTIFLPGEAETIFAIGRHKKMWYFWPLIGILWLCSFIGRKLLLVYPGKYPFDFEPGGLIYYLIYSYEALLAFCFFCIGCGTDTAFGFWIFQICGQMRLLACKFASLKPSEDYPKEIRQCLEKHEMLIKCRNHLQKVFGFIVIWLYVTIALVLCEYIYKLSKMSIKLSFWQSVMLFTFATKFLQAFTYAYCGSIIDIESAKVIEAIYECHWPGSGDRRIMSDVLLLLTQKPMALRSYNYFLISMEMFLKIVNAAVSYFFLLETLEAV